MMRSYLTYDPEDNHNIAADYSVKEFCPRKIGGTRHYAPHLRLTLFRSNSNLERLLVRLHFIQLSYARQLLRTLSPSPDPLSFGRRFGHGDGAAFLADRAA